MITFPWQAPAIPHPDGWAARTRRILQSGVTLPAMAFAITTSVTAGCTPTPDSPPTAEVAYAVDTDLTAAACEAPLRIVAFQDKTGSVAENRTPQLVLAQLEPVIERVEVCGGEIALGTVDERSNWPLVRLHVPEPRPAPARPAREGPPHVVASALARFRSDSVRHAAEDSLRRAEARRKVDTFRTTADSILSSPADAPKTSVLGALSRSSFFLGEHGFWTRRPRMVAILISDAVNNVGGKLEPLPPGTQLYLVNGEVTGNVPGGIDAERFESIEAAIRRILDR